MKPKIKLINVCLQQATIIIYRNFAEDPETHVRNEKKMQKLKRNPNPRAQISPKLT
uniref:Uncharacterized protein n=1 Tax=Rhizophora mucronata TaxID=61149 RepID=A0A2P2R5B8_RHIMU